MAILLILGLTMFNITSDGIFELFIYEIIVVPMFLPYILNDNMDIRALKRIGYMNLM